MRPMPGSEPEYIIIRFKDRDLYNALGPHMAEDIRVIIEKGVKKIFGEHHVRRLDMECRFKVPGMDIELPGTDTLFFVQCHASDVRDITRRLVEEAVAANDRIEMINRGRLGAISAKCPEITEDLFEVFGLEKKI